MPVFSWLTARHTRTKEESCRESSPQFNTTLDGFMEGPNGEGDLDWLMPFVEDGLTDNSHMLATEIDTILLGRVTYQGFAQYWPEQEGDFADLMNKPPKLVFASPGHKGPSSHSRLTRGGTG